jgi:predicted SnoaL-like aldol condensation-catalyzing enzyme
LPRGLSGLPSLPLAEAANFDVKPIVADGDIAVVFIRGQLSPRPAEAVFNIFRLRKGKLVEQWDIRQTVPPSSAKESAFFK